MRVQRDALGTSYQRENTDAHVTEDLLLLYGASWAWWQSFLRLCCCLGPCHRHDSKIIKIVRIKVMHIRRCLHYFPSMKTNSASFPKLYITVLTELSIITFHDELSEALSVVINAITSHLSTNSFGQPVFPFTEYLLRARSKKAC